MKFICVMLLFVTNFRTFSQDVTAIGRSQAIAKGINVSWLEHYWDSHVLSDLKIKDGDFVLIAKMGFNTIRLPVDFEHFYLNASPTQKNLLVSRIDYMIKKCKAYKLKLILVNHYGKLTQKNFQQDSDRLVRLWADLEKRYRQISTENLYFELLNEPTIKDTLWLATAAQVVSVIRKFSPDRTIIIGASNYNSLYELSRIKPINHKNILYTFHFYEPFIFTHQGAEWVDKQVATIGIPFPYLPNLMPKMSRNAIGTGGEPNYNNYSNEGKVGSIRDKIQIAKQWSVKYKVPVLCGEYGAYRKHISDDHIANYISTVRTELLRVGIPGIIWDYNQNFSLFRGPANIKNLSPRMQKALGM
ncbi:glycoside hydrolase family 5 protein [Pedobacter frigidisoli]|nr:cellulase family glycosylhydrolase [Pedobacter frigidisoli]